MGNNNSKSDRLPDSYIENLDKRVSYSSSADISPELRQKFTNAHVVAYLAYSDNPHQALQQLGNIGHTIRLARKANPWIPEANQQYIVASNIDDTEVWIGLRGSTDVLKDWQRNFSLLPVPLAEGKIHCGFHACASEVYTKFISHLVSQGKRVIITGHGKGGATAQALTISLLLNAFEINTADINASVECIAIAAPLIIDSKLGDFVRSKKWDHIFHSIVNEVTMFLHISTYTFNYSL